MRANRGGLARRASEVGRLADVGATPSRLRRPDDSGYRRPEGCAIRSRRARPRRPTRPPPPTVAPEDSAVFGRPSGAGAFAPRSRRPDRRPGRPRARPSPGRWRARSAPPRTRRTASRRRRATASNPPAPRPSRRGGSATRQRDPWRDPAAPFWLGRGAIYSTGEPAQLDPTQDVEHVDEPAAEDGREAAPTVITGGRRPFRAERDRAQHRHRAARRRARRLRRVLAGRARPRRAAPLRRQPGAGRTARPTGRPARSPRSSSRSARRSCRSRSPARTSPATASARAS